MKTVLTIIAVAAIYLAGCASPRLTPTVLQDNASAGPLAIASGEVLTGNDAAFATKLQAVEQARRSIDLAYYIYGDDYSSSALTEALLEAAGRGARIRLLVDYATNYKRLDLFSMMEAMARKGPGSLEVRFYNRPTRNIIQDAVYLTMGCGTALAIEPGERCAKAKLDAIDRLFAAEAVDGRPAAERNVSNLDVGNSGLLLSGLYAKRADVMAIAIQQGQGLDPDLLAQGHGVASTTDTRTAQRLARIMWDSKTAPQFQRLVAQSELYLALSTHGERLATLHETFTGLLPVGKEFSDEARRDWAHITDFLHHKWLLVDESRFQTGGRNVEDSYHMRPNPLSDKYVFMDTDIAVNLQRGGEHVTRAFDQLWRFGQMVATLDEVRRHAPNDFVVNVDAHAAAQEACRNAARAAHSGCVDRAFAARARDLPQRIAARHAEMRRNAETYRRRYADSLEPSRDPVFSLDREAVLTLLQNLPFDQRAAHPTRKFAPAVGREAASGKYLHDTWLRGLADICATATAKNPKQVLIHNAYFFPPANMTYALSRMVNGEIDCSNVTVTVLTNSIETTDLNIVNLMARHSLKAFAEFYEDQGDPLRRAAFRYVEYQPPKDRATQSLHSKVSVIGDDLMIGSANADVRSLAMDSNIALLVRGAPSLQRDYLAFVESVIRDLTRSRETQTAFARATRATRATMIEEDLAVLRQLLVKYRVDSHLDGPQRALLEGRFVSLLDDAYRLTARSIAPDSTAAERERNQNAFNDRFKLI